MTRPTPGRAAARLAVALAAVALTGTPGLQAHAQPPVHARLPADALPAAGLQARAQPPTTQPTGSSTAPPSATSARPPGAVREPCLPPPPAVEPGVPWAQRRLAPEQVWPLTDGSGVTVAVVDTGVDGRSPQLGGGKVLPGVDTTRPGRGPAADDCFGHGTFVAGIIAASPTAGTGYAGVAPGVRVLPVRCATTDTPNLPGSLTPEGMALGIRAAVDAGAQVINLSASTTEDHPGLREAVGYAEWNDVVVVVSAANNPQGGGPATYPAAYPSVIAVGAVDEAGAHAEFSQVGRFVSLVAPGVDVLGLGPGGPGHWKGSGTSYAAPFVAGTAALVRAYHPRLTAAQVKHRLLATADRPAVPLPDPALGWGTVNPRAAVTTVLPEESGQPAVRVSPPDARGADPAPPGGIGPLLAVVAVVGTLCLVPTSLLVVRLVAAARRRRWNRLRVVEIAPPTGTPHP
ncbi:type VII secretion-associated serine protease mycosin [Actinosynnema sp. NPDC050436]|uniref:type VII secretion-associated serine protease mycosin n=1 Tax=Actinosynnema sp. NPDC050436 TaxID=3155659 RepID=UPI0033F990DE